METDTSVIQVPENKNKSLKVLGFVFIVGVSIFFLSKYYFVKNVATTEVSTSEVCGDKTEVINPKGGETFSLNESVNVQYCLSKNIRDNLKPEDLIELYLVDNRNILIGRIDTVKADTNKIDFDLNLLQHWAGLDISKYPPPTGVYRIALIVRQKAPPETRAVDVPADIWDGNLEEAANLSIESVVTDMFFIKGTEPATYLNVISPNGGEIWKMGSSHEIKWKWSGPQTKLWIRLKMNEPYSGDGKSYYSYNIKPVLGVATSTDESFSFYINPKDFPHPGEISSSGYFKIEISYESPFGNLTDISDNPVIISDQEGVPYTE